MSEKQKKSKKSVPNPIPPAGMRADSRGNYGVPHPDRESLSEEYEWRQQHQQ